MLGALGFGFLFLQFQKDQFIACQIAGVLVGFMPAMMLSGLIYEINSIALVSKDFNLFYSCKVLCFIKHYEPFLSGNHFEDDSFKFNLIFGTFALLMFVIVYKITPESLKKETKAVSGINLNRLMSLIIKEFYSVWRDKKAGYFYF